MFQLNRDPGRGVNRCFRPDWVPEDLIMMFPRRDSVARRTPTASWVGRRRGGCWPGRAFIWLLLYLLSSSGAARRALAMGAGQLQAVPKACEGSIRSGTPAAEALKAAISNPTVDNYMALGQFFLDGNDLECAAFAFEAALKLNARNSEARYQLALILMQNGESKRATEELRAIVAESPDFIMAHNALGLALEEQGDLDRAVKEFETTVSLDPSFALGYYNLAHALSAKGRSKAAAFYLEKALALEPQESNYQIALAIAVAQDEKLPKAIELLRKVVSSHPDSVEAHLNLGTVYKKQQRYREAEESYRQVLRVDPQNATALLGFRNHSDARDKLQRGSSLAHRICPLETR